MRRQRRLVSLISLLVMVLVAPVLWTVPATAAKGGPGGGTSTTYPSSMAALGDSITRGYDAAGWFTDWPALSWSTGTDSAVSSHYTRLRALNRKMGSGYNDGKTGAKMSALPGQATTARSQGARYVTILMGANDACTDTVDQMTSVDTFRAQFTNGMEVLAAQAAPPKVLVGSIPDLQQLWRVGKDSSSARSAWSAYGICQSMLANPASTDPVDQARRDQVRQRVVDYNTVLQDVCAGYAAFCKYDGGAVFGYPFRLDQLSGWDYFHPNTAGQAVLADVTWKAGFWPVK
jgi:lysophospholipase L1-like esterase